MGKYCRSRIGTTFNSGKLVVVDGGDKNSYVKVKCITCSEDTELFGTGVFDAQFGGLVSGKIPCGCSKKPIWSLKQYEIRIKRKIMDEKLPIEFISFGKIGKMTGLTPLNLLCKETGEEYTVSNLRSFFLGIGTLGKSYSTTSHIVKYNKDNPSYVVWDNGGKTSSGDIKCSFYCKICESKGLESLFEISAGHLFNNRIPCYCSKLKQNLSGSHVVEMTKNTLDEEGIEDVLVIGAYKTNGAWYSVFLCNTHGVYSKRYCRLHTSGCHCIQCTPPVTGYDRNKRGSLYLLEIQTDFDIILGYGITNKLGNRLTTHRKNLKELDYKILSTRVFEGSGTKVLAVENAIKSLHKTGLIDCEGFRRESISIDRKEEVLELCAGLKEIVYKVNDNP